MKINNIYSFLVFRHADQKIDLHKAFILNKIVYFPVMNNCTYQDSTKHICLSNNCSKCFCIQTLLSQPILVKLRIWVVNWIKCSNFICSVKYCYWYFSKTSIPIAKSSHAEICKGEINECPAINQIFSTTNWFFLYFLIFINILINKCTYSRRFVVKRNDFPCPVYSGFYTWTWSRIVPNTILERNSL